MVWGSVADSIFTFVLNLVIHLFPFPHSPQPPCKSYNSKDEKKELTLWKKTEGNLHLQRSHPPTGPRSVCFPGAPAKWSVMCFIRFPGNRVQKAPRCFPGCHLTLNTLDQVSGVGRAENCRDECGTHSCRLEAGREMTVALSVSGWLTFNLLGLQDMMEFCRAF